MIPLKFQLPLMIVTLFVCIFYIEIWFKRRGIAKKAENNPYMDADYVNDPCNPNNDVVRYCQWDKKACSRHGVLWITILLLLFCTALLWYGMNMDLLSPFIIHLT